MFACGSCSAWIQPPRSVEAVARSLEHFGAIVLDETDDVREGVWLKFTREDVRQIPRLEKLGRDRRFGRRTLTAQPDASVRIIARYRRCHGACSISRETGEYPAKVENENERPQQFICRRRFSQIMRRSDRASHGQLGASVIVATSHLQIGQKTYLQKVTGIPAAQASLGKTDSTRAMKIWNSSM